MKMNLNSDLAKAFLHDDQLLRKHRLSLSLRGERPSLVDSSSERPASKDRVKKYLAEWKLNPGFPGEKVVAQLEAQLNLKKTA